MDVEYSQCAVLNKSLQGQVIGQAALQQAYFPCNKDIVCLQQAHSVPLVGEPISAMAAVTQDRNGQQRALQKQQRLDQCATVMTRLVSTNDLQNGMVHLLPGTQDLQHCVLQGKSVLCWLGEDGRVSKYSTTEEKMDDLQEL